MLADEGGETRQGTETGKDEWKRRRQVSSHRRNKKWGDCDIFTQIDDKYPHHVSWGYGKKNEKDAAAGSYVSVTGKLGDFVYVSTDDYEGTAMFPSTLIPEVVKRLRAIYKQVQSKGQ